MKSKHIKFKKIVLLILITNCSLLITNCSGNLDPEKLPLSVKQNLALLQTDPQFVMYFNFKKMRETSFWATFIQDSIINEERSFGSFLSVLKNATGASITNGIDELYYSNSWFGDNAMVIKGTFNRKKVEDFMMSDTLFTRVTYPPDSTRKQSFTVFKQKEVNLYLYFRDDFTVCASNYQKIIDATFNVTDTSNTGLITNKNAMRSIENIKYKDNLWMMSNQKLFIKGIFENFADMNKGGKSPAGIVQGETRVDSLSTSDTTLNKNSSELQSLYRMINSISFSLKMTDELTVVIQNECDDNRSALDLKNKIEAIAALAKLSSAISKKPSAVIKSLDKLDTEVFDKTAIVKIKFSQNDVSEIRKQKLF